MVQRQFAAFDNDAFTVDSSSPSLTPGSSIINNSNTPVGTVFTFTSGFEYQTIVLDDLDNDPDTFNDDAEEDHIIIDGSGLVANGTEVESESLHFVRALDDNGNPTGPTITITVFSQNGQTTNVWGMAADAELQDGVRYVKTGGSNRGDSEYETFVPCFTLGAKVSTLKGLVAIENLQVGDKVMTRDNGLQEVRWIGCKTLSRARLTQEAVFCPIRIRKGALGQDYPMRDMIVSPNHRMLLVGAHLALNFGEDEMLVAAKHLVGLPGVDSLPPQDVSYVHLLCDRHEVLMVDGAWTESFQPGDQALSAVGKAQSEEIFALFPELRDPDLALNFKTSRQTLRKYEAEVATLGLM